MPQAIADTVTTTVAPTERVIVATADKVNVVDPSSMIVNAFGYQLNLATILITFIIAVLVIFFWRVQSRSELNFADMITPDGKKVSLTKFLQLIGGLASTWFILRLGLDNKLTEGMFGIYLTYIASVEGFSKFMSAKYGYTETSVAEASGGTVAQLEDQAAAVAAAQSAKQTAASAQETAEQSAQLANAIKSQAQSDLDK